MGSTGGVGVVVDLVADFRLVHRPQPGAGTARSTERWGLLAEAGARAA